MTSQASQKQVQRGHAQKIRDGLSVADAASLAADNFLHAFPPSKNETLSLYWPIGSELDTRPLLIKLHEAGVTCALPVIEKKNHPLFFRCWDPEMILQPGPFKVPVPPETAETVMPDVVITPLLAFDAAGYRLGYGGGFYDRTLEKLRRNSRCKAIGFGYVGQEVETVATDQYDQQLDAMVTERDVRIFT
ncbi:5-formyltetrahydrofolate cyclo-ligase [Sneathiella marina]|uniref:5-formyltetrahydrofolate cyclo-ligase n=1 Tax=Sneathiella marina TaxID=2950108 RepID=A0ABY4W686_9PROT|nr:5-formyltetrahydrofolate cyclo-ligase [Sneathiella marina]USG62691.1 5-formyltetrahydrofolate cyclo-ligase [Sneathiella marina]